jgi:hypothetical protein
MVAWHEVPGKVADNVPSCGVRYEELALVSIL